MNVGGGDWMCGACQHINFKKRESCQRCTCPKFPTAADVSSYKPEVQALAGDWYCNAVNCGSHNYASRGSCYRCGASKLHYSANYALHFPGWKTGDWLCARLECSTHNYASRTECYKCKTPRDDTHHQQQQQLYTNHYS